MLVWPEASEKPVRKKFIVNSNVYWQPRFNFKTSDASPEQVALKKWLWKMNPAYKENLHFHRFGIKTIAQLICELAVLLMCFP